MEHKHAIVVDKKGYKKEFVLVAIEDVGGQQVQTPQYYEMQPGESVVFEGVELANSMYAPRWQKGAWVETATEEDIAAIEAQRREEFGAMEPGEPQADPRDLAIAELSMMLAETQMALVDITMIMGGMA